MPGWSKGLQEFHDGVLFPGRQFRAVFLALVAKISVAWQARVKEEKLPPVFLRHISRESYAPRIVHVVAPIKNRRTGRGRFEQFAQRRHRPVVQIRRAQPDAVQGLIGVAKGLAEMSKPLLRISRVEQILVSA